LLGISGDRQRNRQCCHAGGENVKAGDFHEIGVILSCIWRLWNDQYRI
jgi:hypothetical protein